MNVAPNGPAAANVWLGAVPVALPPSENAHAALTVSPGSGSAAVEPKAVGVPSVNGPTAVAVTVGARCWYSIAPESGSAVPLPSPSLPRGWPARSVDTIVFDGSPRSMAGESKRG